MYCSNPSV